MAWDDHPQEPDNAAGNCRQQEPVSRRSVLRTAAGASTAGLMAGLALGALPAAAATRPVQPAPHDEHRAVAEDSAAAGPGGAGPVVVHVRDLGTGEMDIFTGTTQTTLRDPALAALLARAGQ